MCFKLMKQQAFKFFFKFLFFKKKKKRQGEGRRKLSALAHKIHKYLTSQTQELP